MGFKLDGVSSRKISFKRLIFLYNSSDFNLIFKILLSIKFLIKIFIDEDNFFKILVFKSYITKLLVKTLAKLDIKYKKEILIFKEWIILLGCL